MPSSRKFSAVVGAICSGKLRSPGARVVNSHRSTPRSQPPKTATSLARPIAPTARRQGRTSADRRERPSFPDRGNRLSASDVPARRKTTAVAGFIAMKLGTIRLMSSTLRNQPTRTNPPSATTVRPATKASWPARVRVSTITAYQSVTAGRAVRARGASGRLACTAWRETRRCGRARHSARCCRLCSRR